MDSLILVLGMALVTYLTRVTPFFVKVGESRFVRYVPSAVFAALVFPDLLSGADRFIAGLAVFAVTLRNRDLLVAFLTGISVLYVLQLL